jgi:hypothetical protein
LFSQDYFDLVSQEARDWAERAINAAAAPFVEANENGRELRTYELVLGALEEMVRERDSVRTPPLDGMPNPQPPGGGGGV